MMIKNKNDLTNMPLDQLIQGINEFTRTSRERELTAEETARRGDYRTEYLRRIGVNLRTTLDNTTIEYAEDRDDGSNG